MTSKSMSSSILRDQFRSIDAREPVALNGAQLLSPAAISIDFGERTVVDEG